MVQKVEHMQDGSSQNKPVRPTSYPGWDGTLPRHRASLILWRDGRLLLVRDRGRSTYALPGGGVEDHELPIIAAARELQEETGLEATAIRYMFTFEGKYNNHHLYEVEAEGSITVQGEVDGFTWWDTQDETPVYPHVRGIVSRLTADEETDR